MNYNLNEPCRWLSNSTDAENQIRDIFYRHWEKLKDSFILGVNEINAWRQRVIDEVNKHADQQIIVLVEDYQRQNINLDQKREENLDTTHAYCSVQNRDLFIELHNVCQSMEFQVSKLEFLISTMQAPKVVTVPEQIERMKNETVNTTQANSINIRNNPTVEQQDQCENNRNLNANLAVSPTNKTSSEMLTLKLETANNGSNNSKNTSQEQHANDMDLISKCVICFMIFPLEMNRDDRIRHINEHCTVD